MPLADLVAPNAIIPALKVNGKKQALQELAAKAAELSGQNERAIFEILLQREKLGDRKSTRLNSSHQIISYAVFCLKKKRTSPPLHDWSIALKLESSMGSGRQQRRVKCDVADKMNQLGDSRGVIVQYLEPVHKI